ncbi:MAG: hypothetical protein V4773_20150 [Verrucomicrobiota bacterium]
MIWLLLLCSTFTAIGGWMVIDGQKMGWFCGGFFALGLPIFLIQMHPKASFLTVSEDGFKFSSLFRKTHCRWSDIAVFGTYTLRQNGLPVGNFVGFDFVSEYQSSSKMRAASKAMVGFEGGLPDTYGLKAEDLSQLLASYHAEWTRNKERNQPLEPMR